MLLYKSLTSGLKSVDRFVTSETEMNTSQLATLLQKSAVEHLTTSRQLEVKRFGSIATIVTTDYEALYAYKHGDYQRCLQLSTQNVNTLLDADNISCVVVIEVSLLDDDIVSLTALMLIVDPECREKAGNVTLSHTADSVAVSDDAVSVEVTSFSDVTGSNT